MSLRLDPKYHGVRVARVRPKLEALTSDTYVKKWYILRVGDMELNFKRNINGEMVHRAIAARRGNEDFFEINDALEALGLR